MERVHILGAVNKLLVRQNSIRDERENLTPEIVIIKNGTLSRSCTEETERIGDSVQGIYKQIKQNQNFCKKCCRSKIESVYL